MRIVTWNVWWRFGGNWRERQSQILATLERANADVICLQEVWEGEGTSQAERLATGLRMHPVFAAPSLPPTPDPPEYEDQEAIGLGVAVLSRWPVLRHHKHLLPSRHRTAPVALMVTLDHPAGPLHVVSACVEWEAEFADDHLAQTRALAALVASPELDGPLPVVLGVDLNAGPGTALVQPLTEVTTDAWEAAGTGRGRDPELAEPVCAAGGGQPDRPTHRLHPGAARPPGTARRSHARRAGGQPSRRAGAF